LLGGEGIKANKAMTSFKIFYLDEEKKDEDKNFSIILVLNSILSPTSNYVSQKDFSLGKELLLLNDITELSRIIC
jgi:hypothetical protein